MKYISNLRGVETYNVLGKFQVGIENTWRREEGQELSLVFIGKELGTKSNYKNGLWPVVKGGGLTCVSCLWMYFLHWALCLEHNEHKIYYLEYFLECMLLFKNQSASLGEWWIIGYSYKTRVEDKLEEFCNNQEKEDEIFI